MKGKVGIRKALTVALALSAIAAPAALADPPQLQRLEDQAQGRPAASLYTPQALRALGERGSAMAQYYATQAASESLRRFLANDDRHAGVTGSSDRTALVNALRDYDAFRVPQAPLSADEPGGGADWPTIVGGGVLFALLAAFGITAIAGLRSRSRVAQS